MLDLIYFILIMGFFCFGLFLGKFLGEVSK